MWFFFALAAVTPSAFCQQGSISGVLVDESHSSVAQALVKLSVDGGPDREVKSGDDGEFSFGEVPSGKFRLIFTATGFSEKTITGTLQAGEALTLEQTALTVDMLTTEVNVTQTQAEIAETQIKAAEKQRFLGAIPNFLVNYDPDAEPLNAKQKFELTRKTFLDPSSFVITGLIAAVGQAQNSHKGFGQGAQGYAKRYGSSFADFTTNLTIQKFVMPTLFKQDPRYFYRGTGSKRSRLYYALSRSVVCQGDNKRAQFCYSSVASNFGSEALTNMFYPKADRNSVGSVVQNGFIGIAGDAFSNVIEEFVAKRLTWGKK